MARASEVKKAVENARRLLQSHGFDCETTAEELVQWFQADTPYDKDMKVDDILETPLIVAHELVEIDNVKRMGLVLTKHVIVENLQKVDDAHMKAAEVELQLAVSLRDTAHIKERLDDIKAWSEDLSVTPENRDGYRKMYAETLKALEGLVQHESP
jgi:hypothetical protein